MIGANSEDTSDITVINVFSEGPAVSLKGSPTVSPTTPALCASDPGPPNWPVSMNFLALSHKSTSICHQQGKDHTGKNGTAQEPTQSIRAKDEANQQR